MRMDQRRMIILGDNEQAPYHPLHKIEGELHDILGSICALESTTDYRNLNEDQLSAYDLVLCYTDCFKDPVTAEYEAAIISYVNNGGRLLVIHNGVSLFSGEASTALFGARYAGHPPFQTIEFHPAAVQHPILRGMEPFSMDEEAYQFELLHTLADAEILLTYSFEGTEHPAAWVAERGHGRLVYLMPGHHQPSFLYPMYRNLIRNSVEWLLQ